MRKVSVYPIRRETLSANSFKDNFNQMFKDKDKDFHN